MRDYNRHNVTLALDPPVEGAANVTANVSGVASQAIGYGLKQANLVRVSILEREGGKVLSYCKHRASIVQASFPTE